jgi:hypothetical protein
LRAASPKLIRALLAVYGACAVGFAIVLLRWLADPCAIAHTDFTAFWTGWWLVLHGQGAVLYDITAQQAAQHAIVGSGECGPTLLAFLHPPHAALAGTPFGLLADRFGEPLAFRVWTAANLALLVQFVRTTWNLAEVTSPRDRALVAFALAASFPVFLTLREGQVALLLAVAFQGLFTATREGRPRAAAAWLLVLTVKPQLVPVPIVLLIALRRWRVLAWAAGMSAIVAAATAAALGPDIFGHYLAALGTLQRHLGRGVPAAMLSARGFFVRAAGEGHGAVASTLAFVAWAVAALAFGYRWRRGASRETLASAFAAAFATALFFSPHLFPADLSLWAVPLALIVGATDAGTPLGARFRRFALAWPLAITLGLALDGVPRLSLELQTGLCLAGFAWTTAIAKPG